MPSMRNSTSRPVIESVAPQAALPGGEIQIRGKNFPVVPRPVVTIGGCAAPLTVSSSRYIVARVPAEAVYGEVLVHNGSVQSEAAEVEAFVRAHLLTFEPFQFSDPVSGAVYGRCRLEGIRHEVGADALRSLRTTLVIAEGGD